MKVRVHYVHTEITGHHPSDEDNTRGIYELVLANGLDKESLEKAIENSLPKSCPLDYYTLIRHEIIE